MLPIKVYKRYAMALFQLAKEKGVETEVYADMKTVEKVCVENRELDKVLNNPTIKADRKHKILVAIFGDHVQDLSLRLICFSVKQLSGREIKLQNIAQEYDVLYEQEKKIQPVDLLSASPIDDDTKKLIEKKLSDFVQKKIVMRERIDKNLIGGFRIRFADWQYDASVPALLAKIKQSFSSQIKQEEIGFK